MIIQKENRKQLIDFLINRWKIIINFAALEKLYIASYHFSKVNNLPIPKVPSTYIPKACRQIEIIKQFIIKILPEAHFIDYSYETQAPLDPNDFVEMYIADHHQCITKVEEVIKRMKIL